MADDYSVNIKLDVDYSQVKSALQQVNSDVSTLKSTLKNVSPEVSKQLQKQFKDLDSSMKVALNSIKNVSTETKKMSESFENARVDMNLLGMGFLGMQMQRYFQGVLTSSTEMFLGMSAGTSMASQSMAQLSADWTYFQFIVGYTLVTAFEPLINMISSLLEWFSSLSQSDQSLIIEFMAMFTIMGYLLYQVSFLILGFQSLGIEIGAGASGVAIAIGSYIALLGILVLLSDSFLRNVDNSKKFTDAINNIDTSKGKKQISDLIDSMNLDYSGITGFFRELADTITGTFTYMLIVAESSFKKLKVYADAYSTDAGETFKQVIIDVINYGLNKLASFLDSLASGLRSLGLTGTADKVNEMASALKGAVIVLESYSSNVDNIESKLKAIDNETLMKAGTTGNLILMEAIAGTNDISKLKDIYGSAYASLNNSVKTNNQDLTALASTSVGSVNTSLLPNYSNVSSQVANTNNATDSVTSAIDSSNVSVQLSAIVDKLNSVVSDTSGNTTNSSSVVNNTNSNNNTTIYINGTQSVDSTGQSALARAGLTLIEQQQYNQMQTDYNNFINGSSNSSLG